MTMPSHTVKDTFTAQAGMTGLHSGSMASCSECSSSLSENPHPTDADMDSWHPDEHLVDALLAGSKTVMADLGETDRSWAVAGLKAAGLSGSEIAEVLQCSVRLVRAVQAKPLTRAFAYAQTETRTWVDENRLMRHAIDVAHRDRDALASELRRTREKLGRMIDAHVVGTPTCGRCGTPWDAGNTYWNTGKRYCRECNRRKQQAFRDKLKEQTATAVGLFTPERAEFVERALRPGGDL